MFENFELSLPLAGEVYKVRPFFFKGNGLMRLGVKPPITKKELQEELLFILGDGISKLFELRAFLLQRNGHTKPFDGFVKPVYWDLFLVKGEEDHYVQVVGGKAYCTCGSDECEHIALVRKELLVILSQGWRDYQLLPLHRGKLHGLSLLGKLIQTTGGLDKLEVFEPLSMGSYSHDRRRFDSPMLGIEFEVPNYGAELEALRRLASWLHSMRLISAYEADASVEGGELKFEPFPAELPALKERLEAIALIKGLYPSLFEDRGVRAGMHVHINVYPLTELTSDLVKRVRLWLTNLLDLPAIFGREFNRYAHNNRQNDRYVWLSSHNLPRTVEVRLGTPYGDPKKILLGALFIQRVIWALCRGEFKLSRPRKVETFLEKVRPLFSEEEWSEMEPFLRAHYKPQTENVA